MGNTKDKDVRHSSVLAVSGLSGKTITDLHYHFNGSVFVVEVVHSAGSVFIKEKNGVVEIGGNQDWDSGTKQAAV